MDSKHSKNFSDKNECEKQKKASVDFEPEVDASSTGKPEQSPPTLGGDVDL